MSSLKRAWAYSAVLASAFGLMTLADRAHAQTPSLNSSQDAQFRAQTKQQMQLRSLRQRLGNEASNQRTRDAVERANEAAKRARRRALSRE